MPDLAPLTVVAVTYNSRAVIADCVRSVGAQCDGDTDVIVVDNASVDDTIAVARGALPSVRVLPLPTNRGYAAAINAGIAAGVPGADVLVLNPDVCVRPGAISALRRAGHHRVGVTVPRLLEADGTVARSIRREPTATTAWAEAILGGGLAARLGVGETVTAPTQYDRRHTVDWASGAVMFITAACLAAVGPFDESFFLYSEETDFMLRARDAGFRVDFVPDAVVVHRGGDLGTSAELWSRRTVNRVRLQRRRHGRMSTTSFLGASLAGEGVRAVGGRATSRLAVADLLRCGPRIVTASPPPIDAGTGAGHHGPR